MKADEESQIGDGPRMGEQNAANQRFLAEIGGCQSFVALAWIRDKHRFYVEFIARLCRFGLCILFFKIVDEVLPAGGV